MTNLPTQKDLCRSLGKINAYLRMGKKEEAKTWAIDLQDKLINLGLLKKPSK